MSNEHRTRREVRWVDWIQDSTERITSTIEEIHRLIAEIPLDVMRQGGFFEQTADDISDLQRRSISAVYGAVRDVNRRIWGLASDLMDPVPADSES